MNCKKIPIATYRLQFDSSFTFDRAAELVPYLHTLGISHCYASPYLKARKGSLHGYDIVDHNSLNPEIGGEESFRGFVQALHAQDMGQILDLVPNHMGVGGSDNTWWLDVLENGPASRYASYFDIDWSPVRNELQGKVLLPLLGGPYGDVLENGGLDLVFDEKRGEFSARYYEHRFPLDPATYPVILRYDLGKLAERVGKEDRQVVELHSIITSFGHLPSRYETTAGKPERRRQQIERLKGRLAALYRRSPEAAKSIAAGVEAIKGEKGRPQSFDIFHNLLESQAYRLAYWRVAADEINYRRFFDINSLAGLRMEEQEVFDATHELVLKMIVAGEVQGLRIDHPDGLYDPEGYLKRLSEKISAWSRSAEAEGKRKGGEAPSCYILVEKILAAYERLPESWPVHGTTGYEFGSSVNNLLVYGPAEQDFTALYARFIGKRFDYGDLLYERKKFIIETRLSSELTVLANLINKIAQANRHTRDFTLNSLRYSLIEIAACFPVYRTYVCDEKVTEYDRRYMKWALAQARKRNPAAEATIFDFVRAVLLLDDDFLASAPPMAQGLARQFAMKFQQYTAPVMAKALEDTTFYVYTRLLSLNEVGSDPKRFGVSVSAFHYANQERWRSWPHSMLTTSTHDAKRSEDVRARINVLSEISTEWKDRLKRWRHMNRGKKRRLASMLAPAANDEYLLYQTLAGAWPLEELDRKGLEAFRSRVEQYFLKAVREAKVHTAWVNTNQEYEEAATGFVRDILSDEWPNPFLEDMVAFKQRIARFGLFNSLSQLILKLTSPGVPDIYQGSELWNFTLVDPDNRRLVDYKRRQSLLAELQREFLASEQSPEKVFSLLESMEDGRIKLYVLWKCLAVRNDLPALFQEGEYIPLEVKGKFAEHLCAFARRHDGRQLIVAAPRWFARLLGGEEIFPLGEKVWVDTCIEMPGPCRGIKCRDVFTGRWVAHCEEEDLIRLPAAEIFSHLPVALLLCE